MPYKVEYCKATRKKSWGWYMAIGSVLLGIAGHIMGWGKYLIPGDAAVTTLAFDQMVSSLVDGTPVQEAFADFCREIIAHGQIY